jgi:hypothetical protein
VKFEAPMTATKICAGQVFPVSRSMIRDTVSPAYSLLICSLRWEDR